MTWLYVLTLIAWASVLAYMAPAVWSIYRAMTRHGDPARLVCLLFALLQIGFLFRRVVSRETEADGSMAVLLTASIGVAFLTLFTARTYGRGRHV